MMTSTELVRVTGMTYRQLDHWTRCGYIQPKPGTGEGYGKVRQWESPETFVVMAMVRLVRAGFHAHRAAPIAHELVIQGRSTMLLSDGVKLTMLDPMWLDPPEIPGQLNLIEGVV